MSNEKYRELTLIVEGVRAAVIRRSCTGQDCALAFRAVSQGLPKLAEFSSAVQLIAQTGIEWGQIPVARCQITNPDFTRKIPKEEGRNQ